MVLRSDSSAAPTTTREFTYAHRGYVVTATVWNEAAAPDPRILFDFNNVLNAYTMRELHAAAKTFPGAPYAIVSLLSSKGLNFAALGQRAAETGECIVALTVKIRGNRVESETGIKHSAMKRMHWAGVEHAIDDKPHEWHEPTKDGAVALPQIRLLMDASKKPVYLVQLSTAAPAQMRRGCLSSV